MHKHKINTKYLNEVITKMRIGGMSNASVKNRINANKEDSLAWKINDIKPSVFTLKLKPLSKITQYIQPVLDRFIK
jgi:glycosyltransferase